VGLIVLVGFELSLVNVLDVHGEGRLCALWGRHSLLEDNHPLGGRAGMQEQDQDEQVG